MSEFPPLLTRLLRLRPHEVELLRPRHRAPPLSWLLLAVGVAALGAAAMNCLPVWSSRSLLADRAARLQSEVDHLASSRGPVLRGRTSNRAGDRDALSEAELLVVEARRPWHGLFDQLEAAQRSGHAGVHVIQMGVDPRFATLQLVAEGRDLGELVRFSQQLAGNGPVRTMSLTHHEWRDALGAHVVTASLQGELDGAELAANDTLAGPKP